MIESDDRNHSADHAAISGALEGWHFDPDAVADLLRTNLILHLGAFHGWTVRNQGPELGLVPMLVAHDHLHASIDVLRVESLLDPVVVDAIREVEAESR